MRRSFRERRLISVLVRHTFIRRMMTISLKLAFDSTVQAQTHLEMGPGIAVSYHQNIGRALHSRSDQPRPLDHSAYPNPSGAHKPQIRIRVESSICPISESRCSLWPGEPYLSFRSQSMSCDRLSPIASLLDRKDCICHFASR